MLEVKIAKTISQTIACISAAFPAVYCRFDVRRDLWALTLHDVEKIAIIRIAEKPRDIDTVF